MADHEGDALDRVRALLGTDVEVLDTLGGSHRSVVRRIRAGGRSLIVKEYIDGGDGFVREAAALSILPPDASAPRFVAAGDNIVVMSDLGSGPSVADALLGTDPVTATEAVLAWATAIATLHRTTTGLGDDFRTALGPAHPTSSMLTDLTKAASILAARCADLDVVVPAGAVEEIDGLAARLDGAGHAALTPADACPDNNVRVGDRLALIDFEGGQFRHIAWDAAYLRVPWPTCWCAWQIPDVVADAALAVYRKEVGLSYVDTPEFGRDLALAAAGWAIVSTSWFLAGALLDEHEHPNPDATKPMPSRRAMILRRLDTAARVAELPALAELATGLAKTLKHRWGTVALEYAPAFRGS